MAQFDVYRNANPASAVDVPFLVVVQADLLEPMATRVVIPLVRGSVMRPARVLNPTFEVDGATVVLSTAEIAGVPLRALGAPVGTLAAERSAIVRAIDFLLAGV